MDFYLAQVNIAKMLGPIDSPVMSEFKANLDRINEVAENSKGFIWRLKDDTENATAIRVYDDDMIIVNMSVWTNIEDLYSYVYQSAHNEVFKRKKEWFEKMKERHMVLWYTPASRRPGVQDAIERLDYLRKHGESPFAFGFKNRFSVADAMNYVPLKD